jgi:hypothetical protein
VLSVQTLLGHRYVDTTLCYACLYDGTAVSDYYWAIEQLEGRLMSVETGKGEPFYPESLLALLDQLSESAQEEKQSELLRMLRSGILAWVK